MKPLRVFGLALLGCLLVAAGLVSPAVAGERVITVAQYADAVSLDPQHTNDNASYSVEKPMLEGLIGFNEKMEQIPQLAEKWDASADARVYTFYLRKGVKFHDGTPFNAAAVKANFDRVRNPDNKLRRYTLYKVISQIDVIDDSTVRFTLSEPFGAMIATFAHPAGGINSPTAVQKYGADYGKNPVGTGPYKFQEWVPNDHITLVKNPDYWDKNNAAKVDKIIVKPVPEDGTRIAMLQKGDAQFINAVPYSMAEVVQKDKNLSLAESESVYTFWVAMNTQKKPFSDVRVRQAMNYAINKEAIIKAVLRGHGKPANSPLAPQVWGYTPVKTYPYDPAKAKALLAEAGYPNGFKTSPARGRADRSQGNHGGHPGPTQAGGRRCRGRLAARGRPLGGSVQAPGGEPGRDGLCRLVPVHRRRRLGYPPLADQGQLAAHQLHHRLLHQPQSGRAGEGRPTDL